MLHFPQFTLKFIAQIAASAFWKCVRVPSKISKRGSDLWKSAKTAFSRCKLEFSKVDIFWGHLNTDVQFTIRLTCTYCDYCYCQCILMSSAFHCFFVDGVALTDFLFKYLVIGSAGTGKSCLLHQFIENKCKYTHMTHCSVSGLSSGLFCSNTINPWIEAPGFY